MKRYFVAAMLLGGLVMMTACNKEELNVGIPEGAIRLFTESQVDHTTKAFVSGKTVFWRNNDMLDVYIGSGSKQDGTVKVSGENAYIYEQFTVSDVIRAYYPAGVDVSGGASDSPSVDFPSTYACSDSAGYQRIQLPMVARGPVNTTYLEFKHLTAAVNVVMRNNMGYNLSVSKVVVKSNNYYLNQSSKSITLSDNDVSMGTPQTTIADSRKKVEVTFATPFVVPDGSDYKSIQVPIMPIGADNLTIQVYCQGDGKDYLYEYTSSSPALDRRKMLTAFVDLNTSGHMSEVETVLNINSLGTTYTANENVTLTGKLTSNDCTVSITDGVTVTLKDVTATSKYLVIIATGNASLILSGENTITGKSHNIRSASGKELTIDEVDDGGSLTISTVGYKYAAIGSASTTACGDIKINGGEITATGNTAYSTAGIGCGGAGSCGKITINGGTVTATGSGYAAGIGSADSGSSCGAIEISGSTTTVTAYKGTNANNSIGQGHSSSTCTSVSIDPNSTVNQY